MSTNKKCKISSKGVMWGSRDPLLEFWDPLISRGRLKLETSNLAERWRAVSTNEKNAKLGQKGSCGGHMTHFWDFGTPLISRGRLKLGTSNLAHTGCAKKPDHFLKCMTPVYDEVGRLSIYQNVELFIRSKVIFKMSPYLNILGVNLEKPYWPENTN